MLSSYYDFPLRMPLFEITQSFSRLARWVTFIDDSQNCPTSRRFLKRTKSLSFICAIKKRTFLLTISDSKSPRAAA